MSLAALYAHTIALSDPVRLVVRQAHALLDMENAIREDALMSGAMRGEFDVALRFTRNRPTGFRLVPVLK